MTVRAGLALSRVGHLFGFTKLPGLYRPLLALTLVCYLALTQAVKMLLLRRRWI